MKYEVQCLEPERLEMFLERRRRGLDQTLASERSLADNLVEVLNRANEFVPSDAGSILLDDPTDKVDDPAQNKLTFIAAFGEKADLLAGKEIPATDGIAGHVYLSGKAYYTRDASKDRYFNNIIDEATNFTTNSMIALPIRLGDSVCGVLELIRAEEYSETETRLLETFAGYLSVSIQNVLDARYALAIAKRDNLTSLYNDRYLHIALADGIAASRESEKDLALIFLDLDYFKTVNDNHGHLTGSQVLLEVGRLLQEICEDCGGLPCRYGGDEFVVILPDSDLDQALALAETIRERITATTFCAKAGVIQPKPLFLEGLTCSIGVATVLHNLSGVDDEEIRTELLHMADSAMYTAKEAGRNRTVIAGAQSAHPSRAGRVNSGERHLSPARSHPATEPLRAAADD
jgi:diguanylate cyclase (GGDEF)-like protein